MLHVCVCDFRADHLIIRAHSWERLMNSPSQQSLVAVVLSLGVDL